MFDAKHSSQRDNTADVGVIKGEKRESRGIYDREQQSRINKLQSYQNLNCVSSLHAEQFNNQIGQPPNPP